MSKWQWMFTLVGAALAVIAFLFVVDWRQRRVRSARAHFIRRYVFPSELRRRIGLLHPEWSFQQIDRVLAALRQYFGACLSANAGKSRSHVLGMPSHAADAAWHEFILMTRDYSEFCRHAFGRYLHHTPQEQLNERMDLALANTLRHLRLAAGTRQPEEFRAVLAFSAVPVLFALDLELGLSSGSLKEFEVIDRLASQPRKTATGWEAELGSDSGACGSCGDGGGSCGGGGSDS